MGKPKLKSSIRAIFNLRPLSARNLTLVCVQQARTDSFREVCKSFNSMYFSSSIASSSLSEDQISGSHGGKSDGRGPVEEEESFAPRPSSSPAPAESSDSNQDESVAKEAICSQRFFFSPCTTKSIMKQSSGESAQKLQTGGEEIASVKVRCLETEDNLAEMGFCKESVMLAMASHDPYMDFRVSMEEMVEAHELREWSCLQELLHCYLRLNEKKTHKIIILAFVDLLMSLVSEEPSKEEGHVRSCFPSCICLNER